MKERKPGEGVRFTGYRKCTWRRRNNVNAQSCLRCWHGHAELKPPLGFNHVGCQDAHIQPSVFPARFGGYGAVGEEEERS